MDQGHTIRTDRALGLVAISLSGFFAVDDVARFARELHRHIDELGRPANRHLTLCDLSACKIQAQDTLEGFGALIRHPRYMADRAAFVTGGSLARMQVKRILTRPGAACFDDVASARAWLLQRRAEAA